MLLIEHKVLRESISLTLANIMSYVIANVMEVEVIFNLVHGSFSHSLFWYMQDFQSFGLSESTLNYNALI